jgi:hypothetical protein
MTLTPIVIAATDQISEWQCGGDLANKHLPTACRP